MAVLMKTENGNKIHYDILGASQSWHRQRNQFLVFKHHPISVLILRMYPITPLYLRLLRWVMWLISIMYEGCKNKRQTCQYVHIYSLLFVVCCFHNFELLFENADSTLVN